MEIIVYILILVIVSLFCLISNNNNDNSSRSNNNDNYNIDISNSNYYDEVWYDTYYEKLLHTQEWKEFSNHIKSCHNHKCDWCGTNKNLQAHHKVYYKNPKTGYLIDPWEYSDDKMMCLCDYCHKKYHKKYKVNTYYKKFT